MSRLTPEFSRPLSLARLGNDPFCQVIEASEAERTALAHRLDLVSLDKLSAEVRLEREARGCFLLQATFEAEFAQPCVVTLDPVAGSLRESFVLRYGPPDSEPALDAAGIEEPAFEPLESDTIDIGEAVAQEFSLALPPFPRSAEAAVEIAEPASEADGPFAALARLAGRQRS